ncbi:MAG: helix-turn-helix domain-containing protein [Bacilli bacterium]|nr:helix-turn-helix domain-containing protein [Bacilli bacterium]
MYKYLFKNSNYPYTERYYRFLLINFKEQNNQFNFMNILAEALDAKDIIVVDHNYFVFYFNEDEIGIKDIFLSLTVDFGIVARAFNSGKTDSRRVNDFHIIYCYYKEFLEKKPYNFTNVTDLILEVIKKDIKKIKELKPAILNDIYEDSQMEKLILSLFNNNLNVTKTAKDVYMHRNTVINKLEYIKSETGLNIQNFNDALCMYWLITIK